jgi:hypothetical protein
MDVDTKDPFMVNKDSMLKAEKLSKYFIQMAKKIKVNSIEHKEIKDVIYQSKNKTKREMFIEMYTNNPSIDKKRTAEVLGVSLQMIYKYMKEPF